MSSVTTPMIGRFGNQLFQYCHARAYAELNREELRVLPWVGEEVFQIEPTPRPDGQSRVLEGYGQDQASLIYNRRQVREWLKFRPEVEETLVRSDRPKAHLRRGDYGPLGYVLVSEASYVDAAKQYGHDIPDFISEELTTGSWLSDFYAMMTAPVLFRANSTFSWWAGTLGEGTVYSPVVDGLVGGIDRHCNFIAGNWPRFANLPCVTNLHLFSENDRYDYDLSPDDLVIDCGAHQGRFTDTISDRYGCKILAFEPMTTYFEQIASKWMGKSNITAIRSAVGGTSRTESFQLQGDSSGVFANGPSETVQIKGIAYVIGSNEVALLKLNVEGMEFEILEAILAQGLAKQFRNIQVQFHHNAEEAELRYNMIRRGLLETHRPTFDEPWMWQNFERR